MTGPSPGHPRGQPQLDHKLLEGAADPPTGSALQAGTGVKTAQASGSGQPLACVGGPERKDVVTSPPFPVEEPGSRLSQHAQRGNGGAGALEECGTITGVPQGPQERVPNSVLSAVPGTAHRATIEHSVWPATA